MKISQVLITPVGMSCNLKCVYCYNGQFASSKNNILKQETLRRFFSELTEVVGKKVTIIWHGGEPTIIGCKKFENYLKEEEILRSEGIEVRNCLQTNGILLSESWCDLFQSYDVRPSLSIDGPAFIHDLQRYDYHNLPTYNRVMSGMELLRGRGIKHGLLIVITKKSLEFVEEIFKWVIENNIKSFDFLPCFEPELIKNKKEHNSPSPDEFAEFLINFFDLWWKHDDCIKVRIFNDVLRYFLGSKVTICSWRGSCSWIISLNEFGQLFPCSRFHGYKKTSFGQIGNNSLAEILTSSKYINIRNVMLSGQKECINCDRLELCGGGCPLARYSLGDSFSTPYYYCSTRKRLFDHIENKLAIQQTNH